MKVRNLFFAILASAAVLVGCEETEDLGAPAVEVTPSKLVMEQGGESKTVTLIATRDWTVESKPEWVTVTPESGEASTKVQTVTVTVEANTGVNRTGTITFMAGPVDGVVEISQAGEKGESTSISVKDFLEKPVGNEWYTLTGTIKNIKSTEYGNFDLVDETGSVYVYGLTAEKVDNNDKSFSSLNLKENDVLTLCGTRAEFKGTAQVGGPAYYVSHVAGVIDYVSMTDIASVFTTTEEYVSVKGKVVAAGNVSFVINDGGDKNLYVYSKDAPGVAVGDVINVKGSRTEYPDYVNAGVTIDPKLIQITNPVVERISESITAKEKAAENLNAEQVDAYCKSDSPLVKVSATVKVDGGYTNLWFDAEGKIIGSVVSSSLDNEFRNNVKLEITGYYGGRNARGYFNILPVSVAASEEAYIEVAPTSLSFAAAGGEQSFTVTSNVEWTATSSDPANFSVTADGTTVKVKATENTDTEKERTATVTVAAKDNASLSKTVTLTQSKKYVGGEPKVLYTLDATTVKGKDNSYAGSEDIVIDGITWNVTGNTTMLPWRIGGKSLENVERTVYSKTAYNKGLTKIVLTLGTSNLTSLSCKLVYSTNADFSNAKEIPFEYKEGDIELVADFPANCYYRFVFNTTVSGSSNKYVQFSKVAFWGVE